MVWIGRDGGDLLFSTVQGRVKHRNMVRDPRVSVSVIDSADPENYVELRGRVTLSPDLGRRWTPSCPGSTTAGTPVKTGPVRCAWSSGWRSRRPPVTAAHSSYGALGQARGRVSSCWVPCPGWLAAASSRHGPGQARRPRPGRCRCRRCARPAAAPEPLEDAGSSSAGIPTPVSLTVSTALARRAGRDGDQPAGRSELQRVGQQVVVDPMQPARIARISAGGQLAGRSGDPGRVEPAGQAVRGRGVEMGGQVATLPGQAQGGGFGGGQRLQVADHLGQPQHLIAQRAQLARAGRDPVEQRFVARLQDGDRGAQLVRAMFVTRSRRSFSCRLTASAI